MLVVVGCQSVGDERFLDQHELRSSVGPILNRTTVCVRVCLAAQGRGVRVGECVVSSLCPGVFESDFYNCTTNLPFSSGYTIKRLVLHSELKSYFYDDTKYEHFNCTNLVGFLNARSVLQRPILCRTTALTQALHGKRMCKNPRNRFLDLFLHNPAHLYNADTPRSHPLIRRRLTAYRLWRSIKICL